MSSGLALGCGEFTSDGFLDDARASLDGGTSIEARAPDAVPLDAGHPANVQDATSDTLTAQRACGRGTPGPLRAFVTSSKVSANPNNDTGGMDAQCQQRADGAGLGGSWFAWIWTNAYSPILRDNAPLAYTSVDCKVSVTAQLGSLQTGTPDNPITMTESGLVLAANDDAVWTGLPDQGKLRANCTRWTSNDPKAHGTAGRASASDRQFTDSGERSCDTVAHLYCFEK